MAIIDYDIKFFLAIWQTIVLFIILFVTWKSIHRYYEKKTQVAAKLSFAFIFFSIAIIFNLLTSWNGIFSFISISNKKSFFGVFLHQSINAQFAYVFLVLGIYYIYQFSILLNRPDIKEKKIIDYIAIIGCIIIIIYGFVRIWTDEIPVENEIFEILRSVDIYVILLTLILIFPILKTSITLRIRLEKDNEDRQRITYMLLLGIFLLLTILSFILETIYDIISNPKINIFSFSAWIFVILALFSAYYSFYKK